MLKNFVFDKSQPRRIFMIEIECFGVERYKENLKKAIVDNIDNKIIFVDCFNYINQYMFERRQIEKVSKNLFISRIEQPYDLLAILKEIHLSLYFRISRTIMIAPFEHLLKGIDDADHVRTEIQKILKRLEERYQKRIIRLVLIRRWDTQYLLKDRSSTPSLKA